uniref:SDR family NAD(P)-dependent oxidoreductase n=1 Tax=Roseihalotalea indica TaxID=2867963 RepID=A0AA49JHU4_9BACT|nr:SDR family NAD(P)-dependent oxidoreductase [Tunicatimonas sp. TK19036]
MLLQNKNIVIIGGTTGLGLSAALAFVKNGAKVVAVGHSEATGQEAQQQLGENGLVITADATQETTASEAIRQCADHWGGCHGLYHVAGGSGRRFGDGPLHELTLEGWNKTFELNLTSLMLSNQAAVRYFREQKQGGAILNMGSVLGYSPSPHYFATHAYAAAKSAIIGFTKSIAAYYAPDNIRVNVIAPALVETPMAQRAAGDEGIMKFIKTKQPLEGGRIGQPQDADGLATCLLSDQANFITGQVIAVDGGWSISEG